MVEIVLEDIAKIYPGGIRAIDDLKLTINAGELLVLVGPSGCGKTTTLRLLAGLETPSRGVVRMGGHVVNAWPPRRREVAMVFQRPALYPNRTVRDNLALGLTLRQAGGARQVLLQLFNRESYRQVKCASEATAARVGEVARLLGLEGVLERRPQQLSGGQQQRVALGRALVRQARLLLLDEPLSNLDAGMRLELRRELHLLHRRFPATMIYVTHDPVEALTLGDRVAVLRDGRLQQVDRPQALFERPCNRFVAGFIGWPPMSFVEGHLRREGESVAFACGSWIVPLPRESDPGATWQDGSSLTLGIRPEHVAWRKDTVGSGLLMQIALVERLGSSVLVTFTAGRRQVSGLAALDSGLPIEEGQKVMVSLEASHVHLFDPATGLALTTGRPAG